MSVVIDGKEGKIRIFLAAPNLNNRVKRAIENGLATIGDWELLERLVEVARRDGLDMEFVRLDDDGHVEAVYSLEEMEAALELDWEVRPLDG
jgi:hypothetical protein